MPNTPSQALSPAVAALLTTIEKHAHQYEESFLELRDLAARAEETLRNAEGKIDELDHAMAGTISNVESSMQRALQLIESRQNDFNEMFNKLSSVDTTRRELVDLKSLLRWETERAASYFNTARAEIDSQVQSALKTTESRVARLVRRLHDDLRKNENLIQSIVDTHRREYFILSQDLEDYKARLNENKSVIQEVKKMMNERLSQATKEIEERAQAALDSISNAVSQLNDPQLPPEIEQIADFTRKMSKIEKEMQRKVEEAEKKAASAKSAALGIGLTALLLALAALAWTAVR